MGDEKNCDEGQDWKQTQENFFERKTFQFFFKEKEEKRETESLIFAFWTMKVLGKIPDLLFRNYFVP